MKKILLSLAIVTTCILFAPRDASAQVRVGVNIGFPAYYPQQYCAPVVYAQPQVVYAQPIVYRQPRVVYRNPPVVYQTQRVVYRNAPVYQHRNVYHRGGGRAICY